MFDDYDPSQPQAAQSNSAAAEAKVDASDSHGLSNSDDEGSEQDLVENIFHSTASQQAPSSQKAKRRSSAAAGIRGAGPAGGAGGLPAAQAQQQGTPADLLRLKAERKRFMSSKAATVSGGGNGSAPARQRRRASDASGSPAGVGVQEHDGVSRAEFLQMQREVVQFGEWGPAAGQ
jgi:hypothetical protein